MKSERFYTSHWLTQTDLREAVNACVKALAASGISADRAALVPECLADAIKCSNYMTLAGEPFQAVQIDADPDGEGGYDITPDCLRYIDQLWPR